MRAWVNGRLLDDPDEAAVSVLDHGITVGDGVFETVKAVGGQPFALTRHLRRLARSAQGLGLTVPDEGLVRDAVAAVLDGGEGGVGRIRITLTGGPSPLGSDRGTAPPTLIVAAAGESVWEPTTAIATVPWPRNERGALSGLKTTSYAENVVALAYAKRAGASEAIFASTTGLLCEGTGSNVFYVLDGELITPTLESGCLAGVTRALVLEWCGATEKDAPLEVLEQADEIFLASTTRDVQPVRRCDARELDAPGPVTARAQQTWSERSRGDLDP
jgi:branched-chain amino acid aminotransferase